MKTVIENLLKNKKQKYRFCKSNKIRHIKAGSWMTTTVPVRQIEALVDIPKHNIKKGDLGGWIESEENLFQEGDCWIESGVVYGTSVVSGDAYIFKSVVENSLVSDDVYIEEGIIRSSTIRGKSIIHYSTIENTIINNFDMENHLIAEEKPGLVRFTTIYHSDIYHSKLNGKVLIKDSTVYLGNLSGVSGEKTDIDCYPLTISNCEFEIGKEEVTDMPEYMLLLSNNNEDLQIEDVEIRMFTGKADLVVVIAGDGKVKHIITDNLYTIGLYGRLDVQNIVLKNSSLTLNSLIDSKSIIKGQDTSNPVFFMDAYAVLNNTELMGSLYLEGAFEANFLKMDGQSKLIVSGGMPELHNLSLLEDSELNLVSNYEYQNIHIRGNEIVNN